MVKGGGKSSGPDKRRFYVILAVIGVVGVSLLAWLATKSSGRIVMLTNVTPISNQGHVMGSDTALVEIVEFADFECPGCGIFANLTEPDMRARLVNTGIVRFRFMDFPLDVHPNTRTAHNAAWCAGDQGRFWEMHDAIFLNQDRWATQVNRNPIGFMRQLAEQVGLDMNAYGSCMETQKFAPQIQANYEEATARGVPSTPTFIIGNKMISEILSYDDLKRHVDEAVAAARTQRATRPDSLETRPGR